MHFQSKAFREYCDNVDPAIETGLILFNPEILRYFIHASSNHLPKHCGLETEWWIHGRNLFWTHIPAKEQVDLLVDKITLDNGKCSEIKCCRGTGLGGYEDKVWVEVGMITANQVKSWERTVAKESSR